MSFRSFLSRLKPNNTILFLWATALLLNIITFLLLYYKIKPGNSTLALRYNILTGVDLYGKGINLYLIPLVGFLILMLNFFLFRALKGRKILLPFVVVFTTLVVESVLAMSVLLLIRVN
jgi:hypothetical protein